MPEPAHHPLPIRQRAFVLILLMAGAAIAFFAVHTLSPAFAWSQPAPAANATPTVRSAR